MIDKRDEKILEGFLKIFIGFGGFEGLIRLLGIFDKVFFGFLGFMLRILLSF